MPWFPGFVTLRSVFDAMGVFITEASINLVLTMSLSYYAGG